MEPADWFTYFMTFLWGFFISAALGFSSVCSCCERNPVYVCVIGYSWCAGTCVVLFFSAGALLIAGHNVCTS